MDISPDDRRLVSGAEDGTILITDIDTGETLKTASLSDEARAVVFTETGEVSHGDPNLIENEFVYLVEQATGTTELLTPSQFRRLVDSFPPPAVAPFDEAQAKAASRSLGRASRRAGGVRPTSVGMTMVLIPPGEFLMGSTEEEHDTLSWREARAANDRIWAVERIPSEGPQHRVRITRPFRFEP